LHNTKVESESVLKPAAKLFSEESRILYSTLYQVGIDELSLRANVHDWRYNCCHCHSSSEFHGVRYVCAQCQYETICEDCERDSLHERSHLLYKINYNVPFELDQRIARGQLPWQSQGNLSYYSSSEIPNLYFEQIKAIKEFLTYNASTSDIEALYEQFKRLADTVLDLPDFEDLGGITKDALINVLTTRYAISNDALRLFIIDMYDVDCDGIVSFPEYVRGHDLIINAPDERRVTHFAQYLKTRVLGDRSIYDYLIPGNILEQDDIYAMGLRKYLISVLFSYQEMSKHAFADAMSLLQFDRTKVTINDAEVGDTNKNKNAVEKHLQDLLWEDRTEIDSLAFYDDTGAAPLVEMEMAILWDLSIEEFVDEIVGKSLRGRGEFWGRLKNTLMSSPKYVGMINALFETALV
jgi:hypothetical protein